MPGLEGLQRYGVVPVVVEVDVIEVVEPAIHRQVLAPVILDPGIADRAPGLDLLDAVRAAAQRDFQAARGEFAPLPPVLRQHRQLAEDHRKLAVAGVLEVEANPSRALGHHLLHIGVIAAVVRGALAHQRLEGEHHVIGGYRLAIVEASLRAQVEAHPAVVRAFLDLFRQQAIDSERLVQAVGGQCVVDQADVIGGDALVDEGVERVEAAETGLAQRAALGGLGIDVLEVLEIGRVLGLLVIQRQGMAGGGLGQGCHAEQTQQAGAKQRMAHAIVHLLFSRLFSHQARRPSV